MREFTLVLEVLDIGASLKKKVEAVHHDYQTFMPLFHSYQNLFTIVLKFQFTENQNDILNQQSGLLDIFRYGWLFILYFSGISIG